jgi:hypothetical protein
VPLTQSGECSLDGALSTHRAGAAAGETCRQNVERVLRDKDGGGKLGLVLLVVGAKFGSHRRPAWGHIGPTKPFDSGRSPGIWPRPATSADIRDLARIEGVRGSNPLSSPEFLQVSVCLLSIGLDYFAGQRKPCCTA